MRKESMILPRNLRSKVRATEALHLRMIGYSLSEVSDKIGISEVQVVRLIRQEILGGDVVNEETQRDHLSLELHRSEWMIKETTKIIMSKCGICGGSGTVKLDDDAPKDIVVAIREDDTKMGFCPHCEGRGRRHDINAQLKAVEALGRVQDRRGRWLKLDQLGHADLVSHSHEDAMLIGELNQLDPEQMREMLNLWEHTDRENTIDAEIEEILEVEDLPSIGQGDFTP